MKQLFKYAALFIFGLTGNLIAQEYQPSWSASINVPSVGDHINVYPYSDNHNYMYFNADLDLASAYGGHECCTYNPIVADHEDQDGYVVFWPQWTNGAIDIITPTYADNGGISDLGLTQVPNAILRDRFNLAKGDFYWSSGYSTMNDKATLIAIDDLIFDLEVDYTNKDYSIAKRDTIPVLTQHYALDENNSQILVKGVADDKFGQGKAYLSSDGTRHIAVRKRDANVNGEQYTVTDIAFSIKTDSGWKSSYEKVYFPRYNFFHHWEFQDDLNSIKWIDMDGVSVFQLDWYWNALAAQEEFYTNEEENEADFHFTKMGLPLTDRTWDNNNDPTVFALVQQTNLSIQFGLHLETAERSQIVAETYSGDGNYQFIANSDMSIDIFELQENGDYSLIKQVWGNPDAHWWGDGDKKAWNVISLSANYDGTKLWAKSRAIWEDNYSSPNQVLGTLTQITVDYSRPYLTHLSQNEENLLEFNVSFSEIVKSRTFYSDVSYNEGTPSPKDFQIILDGQAVDESSASIRNVRSINQDPNCPSCYNPSDTFVISLRTPNGAISGDLSFAMSESSYVIDNYDNSIEKDSTTNSVSIADFDGLGYILNSETTEELIANLNYAGSSDTLLLQKGTYEIENRLDLGEKAITLTSTYDSDVDNQDAILETIIAYTGSEECVTFLSAYPDDGELSIINGLTFQGKVTSCETRNDIGGNGHVMFINNIVKGFNYGLRVNGGQAKEEGVKIQHIIENNLFTENILGLTLENGELLVTDNLIWRNGADETSPSTPCRQGGLRIQDDDSFVLYNMILENTMYNGCDDRSPGVLFEWSPYTIFMNNVVYGNSGSKANNISQREFGMPTVDHNVIGNFGSGRNKVLNPGPNNFDEDPQITISEEPLAEEEGYVVMQHMGLYVKVNENSVLFGNGFEVEATEGMIGHRLPQPFGSAPDILAFEHSNGMMANPMVSVDLNYPIDAASDIGVNPAFGWEPIKYATQYEIEISSSSEFNNSLKVVVQGLELANLENNLEAIDGAYYWRVRGINPTKVGDWSEIRSFTTGGSVVQPLGPTKLLEPINDQTDVNTLASFNWEAVEEASGYSLQIATDDNFSAIIRDLTTATNSLSLSEALDENKDYFWRVKALNENPARNSDWTNTFRFVTMSSVSNESLAGIPMNYDLYQNYPNPFNPNTQIRYALPEASIVRVEVYNSLGQQVAVLVDGHMNAGYHQLSFNATGLSSGVYLYKITTPNYSMTKKMLLMK